MPRIIGLTISPPATRSANRGFRVGERVWARIPDAIDNSYAAPRVGALQVRRALATVVLAAHLPDRHQMAIRFDFGAQAQVPVESCFHDNHQYHDWMAALAARRAAQGVLDEVAAADLEGSKTMSARRRLAAAALVDKCWWAVAASNPYR